jgi:hypothetical protein
MGTVKLLPRVLTVLETHNDPNAPSDRFGDPKKRCERCGKWVSALGLGAHRKNVHGTKRRAKAGAVA